MHFEDTPEEAAFRAEVRAWLEKNAERKSPGDDADRSMGEGTRDHVKDAKAWQKKKADAGWACLRWPKEYGGREATPIQQVIWNQEESNFKVPPDVFAIGIGMCGPTILTHGTEEQKRKWIPKMLTGEEVWCQLFSEPAAGSDLGGLRTSAVRQGDDWIINGQKIWTTGAHFCDWGVLVTRHDFDAQKHAGLTYFVVDMKAPGVEVRPITQINGGRNFNEVFFTDVRIPDAHRLGEVGEGWKVSITTLMNERATIMGGGGTGGVGELLRLARTTQRNGKPAIEDPAVRQRLAEFYTRSKGLQYTSYRILTAISRGRLPGPEASIGKLVSASLVQEMAAFAIELQGVDGAVMDPGDGALWQDTWLGIPGLRIAGGSDEIMRNIISERVLGLPPEPRADKGIPFRQIPSGR
jgi:acyl-CoA dehydrogenase